MKISAVIITFNEENNIAAAIESVAWADEILVVDSESQDRTRAVAEAAGARVLTRKWEGFSSQKRFAAEAAANDWIFSLDADERASRALQNEITALRNRKGVAYGYKIPRLSIYMGREIRHGGWYPDLQLRLFDRRHGRWKDMIVHESVEMDDGSNVERLRSDILHYSVENVLHHHRMIGQRYAPLAALQMFKTGRRTSTLKIAAAGPSAFIRGYLLKAGFLDGLPGFAIAGFAAHNAFLKHLLLYEMQNDESADK